MKLRIEEQTMPVVKFNYDEIKSQLESALENYKDLVVTEEQLPEIKREQKDLAGLRRKIDTYRKDVKKEMSEPIKQFETKCKNLVEMIADVETPLKDGISFYEEKQRQERIEQVKEMIQYWVNEHNLTGEFANIEPDERWGNKSITIKEIESGIKTACINRKQRQDRYQKNVAAIKNKIQQINVDLNLASSITENDFDLSIDFDFIEMLNKVEKVAKARKQIEIDAEKRAEERRLREEQRKEEEARRAEERRLREEQRKTEEAKRAEERRLQIEKQKDQDIKLGIKTNKIAQEIEESSKQNVKAQIMSKIIEQEEKLFYEEEEFDDDDDLYSESYITNVLLRLKDKNKHPQWNAAIEAAIEELFGDDDSIF